MIEKKKKYKLGDFNYALPKKFIAQQPAPRRDGSKLRLSIEILAILNIRSLAIFLNI